MTRFGLDPEDGVCDEKNNDIYFSVGLSMEKFKSKIRAQNICLIEERIRVLNEKSKQGGDEMVKDFEERLRIHQENFQGKELTPDSSRDERIVTDELPGFCNSKSIPSERLCHDELPGFCYRTNIPSKSLLFDEFPGFVRSKIITPKVKDSVYSSPLLKELNLTKVPSTPTPLQSIPQSGIVPTTSANLFTPAASSKPWADAGKSIFMSTPFDKVIPAFSPPATAIKGPPSAVSNLFETPGPSTTPSLVKENKVPISVSRSTTQHTPVSIEKSKLIISQAHLASVSEMEEDSGKSEEDFAATHPLSELAASFREYYVSEIVYREEVNNVIKQFESSVSSSVRSQIKRSIIEKISISAKKHAPESDIVSTADYLSELFKGRPQIGANEQTVILATPAAVMYSMSVACDQFIKLVEQDEELTKVICEIMVRIGAEYLKFDQVVLGRIMQSSTLLAMDKDECFSKCEWIGCHSEGRILFINQERSLVKIFFQLHVAAMSSKVRNENYPLKNIWRCISWILNSPAVPLATPFVLNELLKTCGPLMTLHYKRQMKKCVMIARGPLIQKLEDHLEQSPVLQKAGQAMHISVLRNTIDIF